MRCTLALALLFALAAEPAIASEPLFQPRAAVSDNVLHSVRGTQSWQLTPTSLARLADGETSHYLRWAGTNGRTQMDVWWGTIGASLIATSVRAQD